MSYEAGVLGLIKAYGFKAVCGAIGVSMLYLALPPLNKDGTFNRKEFICRMAAAIIFSTWLGDWFVSVVDGVLPMVKAHEFPGVFYAFIGAPAWFITRGIAVWMHNRQDKDIGEVIKDAKDIV